MFVKLPRDVFLSLNKFLKKGFLYLRNFLRLRDPAIIVRCILEFPEFPRANHGEMFTAGVGSSLFCANALHLLYFVYNIGNVLLPKLLRLLFCSKTGSTSQAAAPCTRGQTVPLHGQIFSGRCETV
jgi:hypothetical protein